ncbi:MAG: class I SAM-dependent methyltransferase [Balneolales bacterium]
MSTATGNPTGFNDQCINPLPVSGSEQYYRTVADYFDQDAVDFERRYDENPVLQKIRGDFRQVTLAYPFRKAMEIGCGPGLDVIWFATQFPNRQIDAIDVSPGMTRLAAKKIYDAGVDNARVKTGSVEHISRLYPGETYDLVYVYFGGLNTVYDLGTAARHLHKAVHADATLVLTFVNRYYLADIPLWLVRGHMKRAFDRLLNRWQGYSPDKSAPSRAISQSDVKKAFHHRFTIVDHRGYSILYPAWYRAHLLDYLPGRGESLWKLDQYMNSTPFWNTGEYSLYVLKPNQG